MGNILDPVKQSADEESKRRVAKFVKVGLIVLVALLALAYIRQEAPAPTQAKKENRTAKRYSPDPADVTRLYSINISKDFQENALRAEEGLKGRWFRITGEITSIGKSVGGKPYLVLQGSNRFRGVQCVFPSPPPNRLLYADKGEYLTVYGTYQGYVASMVVFNQCKFVD